MGIDWLPSPEVDAEYDGYAKFYDSIDALVMGSMTYEQVLGFEIGYPGKLSYVLTSRNLSTTRADTFVEGGVEEVIESVQKKGYKVWLMGWFCCILIH